MARLAKHLKIPTFYALPKIHKDRKNPPGPAIISGNGSFLERLCRLIDEHLRPFVISLPSYVKDTIHFLKIIDGLSISENSTLVTIDVEALYSSIPHTLGLAAIRHILSQQIEDEWLYSEFVIQSLEFILNHNVFFFDGSHYFQVQGVAMGTCCAPSYANLYLGEWERSLMADEQLSIYTDHITMWVRYIDDVFSIWDGSTEALSAFFGQAQQKLVQSNFYHVITL